MVFFSEKVGLKYILSYLVVFSDVSYGIKIKVVFFLYLNEYIRVFKLKFYFKFLG